MTLSPNFEEIKRASADHSTNYSIAAKRTEKFEILTERLGSKCSVINETDIALLEKQLDDLCPRR